MNDLKKIITPKRVFFGMVCCFAFFSIVSLIKTRGAILDDLGFGNDGYMDFFNHIAYVDNPKQVYFSNEHACFPPLVYLMYLFFNRIVPAGSVVMQNINVSPYIMLVYIVYVAAASIMFYCAVNKFLKISSNIERFLVFFSIFFSNIFILGVIERGNSVLLVMICLLYALDYKESQSKVKREIALILIAVSAGIKVYPAIFGLIYLKEKRFKEAVRLIIYGILLFFIPFVFFGGFNGLVQFVKLQFGIHTNHVSNTIYSIHALLRYITGAASEASWVKIVTLLIGLGFIAGFFLLPFKKWQQYFILVITMILLPFWSGYYTMIYLAIPLLALLNDSEKCVEKNKADTIALYLIYGLFAIIFSFTIFLEAFSVEMLEFGRFVEYCSLYGLIVLVFVIGIRNFIKKKNI